ADVRRLRPPAAVRPPRDCATDHKLRTGPDRHPARRRRPATVPCPAHRLVSCRSAVAAAGSAGGDAPPQPPDCRPVASWTTARPDPLRRAHRGYGWTEPAPAPGPPDPPPSGT